MPLMPLQLIINAVLVLVFLMIVIVMMRQGARYDFNYGIREIQEPIKRQMMYFIFILLCIGLFGVLYNLIVAFL